MSIPLEFRLHHQSSILPMYLFLNFSSYTFFSRANNAKIISHRPVSIKIAFIPVSCVSKASTRSFPPSVLLAAVEFYATSSFSSKSLLKLSRDKWKTRKEKIFVHHSAVLFTQPIQLRYVGYWPVEPNKGECIKSMKAVHLVYEILSSTSIITCVKNLSSKFLIIREFQMRHRKYTKDVNSLTKKNSRYQKVRKNYNIETIISQFTYNLGKNYCV